MVTENEVAVHKYIGDVFSNKRYVISVCRYVYTIDNFIMHGSHYVVNTKHCIQHTCTNS